MPSISIKDLLRVIDTQICILLNILNMPRVDLMIQEANRMYTFNEDAVQYSQLVGKLLHVFLNSVSSYIHSRWAGIPDELTLIRRQLTKVQEAIRGPHWMVATTLTQQATENKTLFGDKLHVMAAVQPIILITAYAVTFGEHIIAVHSPLSVEEVPFETSTNSHPQENEEERAM